jgi:NAD(P)-dependent dehydrogenase (short-subunit alcohol dehydrogenase family)
MEKTFLIAGKNFPAGGSFAEGMSRTGYNVAITGTPDSGHSSLSSKGITVLPWNNGSSVSARSLILETENVFGSIDAVILYFDASFFTVQFSSYTPEDVSRALDIMIAGYQYLAMEVLNRFEQKKNGGRLIFLLKTYPTMAEVLHSSALKNSTTGPSGPILAASQAAFGAYAENTAALAGDRDSSSVILFSCTAQNDIAEKDASLAAWLSNYLAVMEQLKTKPGVKQSTSWIKAGSKGPGLLSRLL